MSAYISRVAKGIRSIAPGSAFENGWIPKDLDPTCSFPTQSIMLFVKLEAKNSGNIALCGFLWLQVSVCHQKQVRECGSKIRSINILGQVKKILKNTTHYRNTLTACFVKRLVKQPINCEGKEKKGNWSPQHLLQNTNHKSRAITKIEATD